MRIGFSITNFLPKTGIKGDTRKPLAMLAAVASGMIGRQTGKPDILSGASRHNSTGHQSRQPKTLRKISQDKPSIIPLLLSIPYQRV